MTASSAVYYSGAKSFLLNGNSFYQLVALQGGKTYTLSAYIRMDTAAAGGIRLAFLNDNGGAISGASSPLLSASTKGVNGNWQRLSVTYTPASSCVVRASVISTDLGGSAYADCIQLEEEDAASTCNLLEDGSFENLTSFPAPSDSVFGWYAYGNVTVRTNSSSSADAANTHFGAHGTQVVGGSGGQRISQSVTLNAPAGTTFLLSGWAKGHSAPNPAKEFSDSARFFGLAVRLDYSDGTTEFHSVPFDWSTEDWQCAAGNIVPKKENLTITQAVVFCAYDNNAGSAAFDNISLRQEPIPTYAYDDDGNLISATQSGNEKSSREYDGVDLVKYTDLNGVTYTYSYNSKHQPVTAIGGNLQTTYAYDTATGRATSTTVKKDGTTSSVFLQSTSAATNDPNHADQATDVNGSTTTYTYNAPKELLIAVKNANNVTTNYTYNNQNDRPNTTFQSGIAAVTYYYNQGAISLLSRKTFASAGSSTPIWQCYSFGMNEWGQRTSVSVGTSSDGNNWTTRDLATYLYEDNGGNLSKITYANGNNVRESLNK